MYFCFQRKLNSSDSNADHLLRLKSGAQAVSTAALERGHEVAPAAPV